METTETTQPLEPQDALEALDRAKKLGLRVEHLESVNLKLYRGIKTLADAVLIEAVEREWCDDYNDFVEVVNQKAGMEMLLMMKKSFSRTLNITIEVNGSDNEEEIWENIEGVIEQYCYDEGIEVSL